MNLEINLDLNLDLELELVDSILKSFFLAICHHQNYLIHHHEACFYKNDSASLYKPIKAYP